MVTFKSALLLLALGTEALAASPSVICQSKLGPQSIPPNKIPRATTTIHNKVTVQKKVIRKVNVVVIPRPITTTSTEVKTITDTTQADPDVETAIETKTDTTTTNQVRLHTTTSTSISSTTTTKYTTSTVTAPAGFIPAKGGDWQAKIKARDLLGARAVPGDLMDGLPSGPEYVQRVDCVKNIPTTSIKVTTVTVQGTRVTAKPKTKTKVITSFSTTIETQYPPKVTETSFETTVSTVTEYDDRTETGTATEVVTVESVIPADPYYEACGDNNMLRTANGGNRIVSATRNLNCVGFPTSGPKNAYECCVQCQKSSTCLITIWREDSSSCLLYTPSPSPGVCSSNMNQLLTFTYVTKADATTGNTYSNGPCGKVGNGGNRT
ncbi:hypothetical protein FSPOR_11491 [Fusarium sporotrichioides]|uniref:Apple domain-containing protein n=1 Tax=Fusarium sporotrichioides TaxID=5514 RepID=A0A395RGF0_FUSSP|nr:hypothetical protein FSPOR_11491 [Fusarium sporotrichioides]